MNSTPLRPTSTIRLTALPPPPPTPITLIFAPRRASGSSVSRSLSASRLSGSLMPLLLSFTALEEFLEDPAQPHGYASKRPGPHPHRFGGPVPVRIQTEPDRSCEDRAAHVICQPPDADGGAPPDGQIENLFGDFRHALENRAAAGEHDAGVERLLIAGALD